MEKDNASGCNAKTIRIYENEKVKYWSTYVFLCAPAPPALSRPVGG